MPSDSLKSERNIIAYYAPLMLVAAAFSLGILLDKLLSLPLTISLCGILLLLSSWALLFIRNRGILGSALLLLTISLTGSYAHHKQWNLFPENEIARFANVDSQPVALRAILLDQPRSIPASTKDPLSIIPADATLRVPVEVIKIRSGRTWQQASGKAMLIIHAGSINLNVGSEIQLFAQLSRSEHPLNPGEFDFAANNRSRRSLCLLRANSVDCVELQRQPVKFSLFNSLCLIRSQASRQLQGSIKEELFPVANALLLGRRDHMSRTLNQQFMQTGTIHLLAISGMHLGVIAFVVYGGLRLFPLPLWLAPVATMVVIFAYLFLIDARSPVIRAAILVSIFCLGQVISQRVNLWNSLAAAWIIVLIANPSEQFQIGTQLSFLAVATLIWFAPYLNKTPQQDPLDKLIADTRPLLIRLLKSIGRSLCKIYLASMLIWLIALPLVMTNFHLFSPGAWALSPLLFIPVALAMICGILALGFQLLYPPLGSMLADFSSGNLQLLHEVTHWTANQTWSHTYVAGPASWWIYGFYFLLFGLANFVKSQRVSFRWAVAFIAVWIMIGITADWTKTEINRQQQQLCCTFISVGHGTSVLIEFPGDRTMLYDCGRLGSPSAASESVSSVLWSKGITHLDAVILSHADLDHYNGVPQLLEKFSVSTVYCSPVMFFEESPALTHLKKEIVKHEIPIQEIYSGDKLKVHEEVIVKVLHPDDRGSLGSDNANSIVLAIEFAEKKILLPGDLETPGMEELLAEEPNKFDIVMAPHHGSLRSDPAGFVDWAQPTWIVVSSGNRAKDLPAIQSLESSGGKVFCTADSGAVSFTLTKPLLKVSPFRTNN